ncbi:lytic transglycosylase domain-containing protein [Yersinia hibernica]|uniref:Lytic transglycosylase domain-containing protein n=1 Tax=Yersinia enterocolitica LC20 TaxID=1443113 RepID=A0A7U4K056_YEREN|nr:lytic transglycosylase domain-containing protein [Yersinia hibernica]AHM72080.1 lytic transglycosylase domain-containing protein [Yersinia hibernica]
MGNAFDFELTATDQASASIQRIDEAVKNLLPKLDQTQSGLKLGGQESVEGLDDLNTRLQGMGQLAREGVQFVGDLVPPLKMVGEIGGKALKFGGIAAAGGYVIHGLAKGLGEAAGNAYQLDTAAKNAGMSVDNFSRISGAMQILGVDSDSARQSVEGLYKTFNDPLWARNETTQALLAQNGIVIERLKDGTADVYKTLDNVAKIFPKLSPQTQKTLADALGLNAPLLALMREGARYKELLAKSDKFNLTVDPKTNAQLVELNTQLNEASAAIDGLMVRGKIWTAQKLLPDEKMVKGSAATQLHDLTMRENDDKNSFAHGDKQKDILHRARVDDEFKNTLSLKEKTYLTLGYPDKDFTQKLNDHYSAAWDEQEKKRLEVESKKLAAPVNTPYMLPGEGQQQARLKQLELQYNLPSTLLDRVYLNESNRGKNLLSPKGAEGPFQFMPATGRDYGLNTTADRMDFNKSSEAAAKYLADLLKDFDGDVNQAVASYNWGQGNVKKHGLGKAPAETRNYLQKIMPGLPAIHPQPSAVAANTDTSGINVLSPTSINSPQQSNAGGADQIANAIVQAMRDNKAEVELTIVDGRTGERKVISGSQGGKISTSMNL